jgi:uncharacterized protein YdhG (YjbR/CyaY superfamily)
METKIMDVNSYIAQFDGEVRARLEAMRRTLQEAAPEAAESMGYGMPAYKLDGKPLVYFAAFPRHIGFYATPNGHAAFKKEFAQYKQGKGSVQFPHDAPLPLDLVRRVIDFRIAQIR